MRTGKTARYKGAMMLFGILPIMAREFGVEEKQILRCEHEYEDERKSLHDLLRSPMTLAQGAAIMNAYRRGKEMRKNGTYNP